MIKISRKDLRSSLDERESFAAELRRPDNSVLLATCNRVEIYSGGGRIPRELARHLFRVTAGLESALIGETAIQGQVKEAYQAARTSYPLSKELHRLFQRSLRAGKRARSETLISRGAMSHSQAVIEILKMKEVKIGASRILIIGASNLNEKVLQQLARSGNRTTFVASRSHRRAEELGRKYHCAVVKYGALGPVLAETDVLISATSAPHYILKDGAFNCRRNIVIFDLAFPRNIDPRIGARPNVELLNLEDIEGLLKDNQARRQAEIAAVEKIIAEELESLYA
jgi:glutamyl-tRNA reductase